MSRATAMATASSAAPACRQWRRRGASAEALAPLLLGAAALAAGRHGLSVSWCLGVGAEGGAAAEVAEAPASTARRRSALGAVAAAAGTGLLEPADASEGQLGEELRGDRQLSEGELKACRCCDIDWCITSCTVNRKTTECNCHQYLQQKGFKVPLSAAAAYAQGGPQGYPEVSGWQEAELPRWAPIKDSSTYAAPSKFPGAGLGLFANASLPKYSVLPYWGEVLSFRDYGRKRGKLEELEYLMCFQRVYDASDEELESRGDKPSYCVDAQPWMANNPARYVNSVANKRQCKSLNMEICSLGEIFFYRATRDIPAGAELITDYGGLYWDNGFEGC